MQQAVTLSRPLDGLRRSAGQLKLRAAALARAYPRETIGFGVLGFAVAAALGGAPPSRMEITPEPRRSGATGSAAAPDPPARSRTGREGQRRDPGCERSESRRAAFQVRGQQCCADAGARVPRERGSITKPVARTTTASAQVAQVVPTVSVTPPFRRASAASSIRARPVRPDASSPSPATGPMYRQPDADSWKRAYRIAEAALAG